MEEAAKQQMKSFDQMFTGIQKATKKYTDLLIADMVRAQKDNQKFWQDERQLNFISSAYLLISPALVIIDILARYFNWF